MASGINFEEYAGVRNLVIAPITIDASGNEVYGAVQRLSGVQAISGEVNESSETHYYDDMAAIVVDSEGEDTYTITVSIPAKETRALIEGLTFDSTTGALIGSKKNKQYFALGFIAGKLNGHDEYNWIYKGKFNGGAKTHNTLTDGVESSNMEYTFTSIHSGKSYTKGGHVKYLSVDDDGSCDLSTFFSTVTTPDSLVAEDYTLTITQASGTTVNVTKNGTAVQTGATIHVRDELVITVTGGTVKVNGNAFTSGSTYTVAGDTTIVSTASAAG